MQNVDNQTDLVRLFRKCLKEKKQREEIRKVRKRKRGIKPLKNTISLGKHIHTT